jgi:hypothetical protein
MRLVLVPVVALMLAGCGSAAEQPRVPASSGEDTVLVPSTEAEADPTEARPPVIVLRSTGGEQEAVPGSFCADYVDSDSGEGVGVCGDSVPVHPKAVTAVARGDEVTLVFSGAKVVRPSGCHSEDEQDCIGSVSVKPLGCQDHELESVPLNLGPETRWTVDLEPGAYQLDVFGYFESDEGATGDVNGSLGLTVAGPQENDALGVFAVKPSLAVCPFTD